jgi:hypothetical protein
MIASSGQRNRQNPEYGKRIEANSTVKVAQVRTIKQKRCGRNERRTSNSKTPTEKGMALVKFRIRRKRVKGDGKG